MEASLVKRILAIVVPLAILFCLIGWRYEQKTAADNASKKLSASRKNAATIVTTAIAKPATVAEQINVVGSIESPFSVKLAPNIGQNRLLAGSRGRPCAGGSGPGAP
jgi:multidrug efflux pump subunit AcrA (membrane-fusion protein)